MSTSSESALAAQEVHHVLMGLAPGVGSAASTCRCDARRSRLKGSDFAGLAALKLRGAALIAALSTSLAFTAAPASAEVLVSNIDQTTSTAENLASYDVAQEFTTGSNSSGYTLESVEIKFSSSAPSGVSVRLATGVSATSAGTDVVTLSNPASTTSGNNTFTAPDGTTLSADTTYFVVVEGTSGRPVTTTSDSEDAGGATGWSVGDGRRRRGADSTGSFGTGLSNSLMIRVNGSAVASDPTITITAGTTPVTEGTAADFTVTASSAPTANLTVNLRVGEGASSNYVAPADEGLKTVQIDANTTSATYSVTTQDDSTDEPNGFVRVGLREGSGYTLGSTTAADVQVHDNDLPLPAITGVAITSTPVHDADDNGTPDTYLLNDNIDVSVTWDQDVTWDLSAGNNATLRVRLTVGSNTRRADLVTGGLQTGTSRSLTFRYAVASEDSDSDGVAVTPNAGGTLVLTPGNATLEATNGQAADRDHAGLAADANHKVDGSKARTAPGAPGAPTVESASQTSLSVSWNAPSDLGSAVSIADYDLRYYAGTSAPANASDWIEEGETNGPPDPGDATSATITGLTAGTAYVVQVRAAGDGLEGPWSATQSATTQSDTASEPTITITAGSAVTEGTAAEFTITASPAPTADLTVNLTVADASGSDFVASGDEGSQTVTIAANAATATYSVTTQSDTTDEPNGDVTVTVASGTGYTVGSTSSASVTVNDDDDDLPIITISGGSAVTEGMAAHFTVTADRAPGSNLIVNLTAIDFTGGSDFLASTDEVSMTVTIAASATTAVFSVQTVNDSNDEPDGYILVQLDAGTGYTLGGVTTASVDVSDNDPSNLTNVLVSTIGQQGATPIISFADFDFAQGFTTGANTDGYTLEGIDIALDDHPENVSVRVATGVSTSSAGTVVATLTNPASVSNGHLTFTAPANTSLSANTTYYVVIEGSIGKPLMTSSDAEDMGAAAGWSVENTIFRRDSRLSGGWSHSSASTARIRVRGTAVGATVPAITIAAGTSPVTEGTAAEFTLTADPAPSSDLTVSLSVSEVDGSDFVASGDEGSKTVTISANSTSATYSVTTQADSTDEPNGSVTVEVTSGAGYTVGSTSSATVTVNDDDETPNNAPVFTNQPTTASVEENSTGGTQVETITAMDADAGDTITYSLDSTSDAVFDIDSSGAITVQANAALNYEATSSYTITVTATDSRGATATHQVTVTVTDKDEPPDAPSAPSVTGASSRSVTVSWTAPDTTGRPGITDYDVQYKLSTATDWEDHAFDSTTTSTTITGLTPGATYQVQVKAKNDEGESAWSDEGEGSTSANAAPVFTNQPAAASVPENSPADTAVATITATDADAGDTITYTLDSTSDAVFDIDSSTGAITVQAADSLDYEANDSHTVTVTATDAFSAAAEHSLTVTVTDVNEAPDAPAAPNVTGASKTSVTVTWAAPDTAGIPPITDYDVEYKLSTEDDWQTHDFTGTGTTTTISSLNVGVIYQARVLARNDEGDSEWSTAGSGATTANAAPVFTNQPTTAPVPENSPADTTVVTVTATDANSEDTLEYSLDTASDAVFDIDSSAGTITVQADDSLDFEDEDSHTVTVTADDGTVQVSHTVTVSVTDVAEAPDAPDAPNVTGASKASVTVSWTAPDVTGKPPITDYDVEYRLPTEDDWETHDFTGTDTSTTISDLNAGATYQARVLARNDEGDSDWSSAGSGATNANAAPVFTNQPTTASVPENSAGNTSVVTIIATDPDSEDTLEYSLDTVSDAVFDIDSDGNITVQTGATLDHEATPSYTVTVTASDGTADIDHTVTINLADRDEPPDTPGAPTVTGASTTSLQVSWVAPDMTGKPPITDYDLRYKLAESAGWVGYRLNPDPADLSAPDRPFTGTSITMSPLEVGQTYEVQVLARNDEGASDFSVTGTGTTLSPTNSAPVFTNQPTTASVDENSDGGTAVVTITATDADNDTLEYSLDAVSDAVFNIDESTGTITVQADDTLDFEAQASHGAVVSVTDGTATQSHSLTINVNDVPEEPDAPDAPSVTGASTTSLTVSWEAPDTTGIPPITDYDVQYRPSGTTQWTNAGYEGTDTSTTISNLSSGTTYEVQVKAYNDEGESGWSGTGSGATDTATNAAPVFTGQPATASVDENSEGGTVVVTITATDADAGDTIAYSLDPDSDAVFNIDSSGNITVQDDDSLDHEATSSHTVTVTASDGTETDTHSLTINVNDVAEEPDPPAPPNVTGASPTSVTVNWTAPDTTGMPPITDYDVRYKLSTETEWSVHDFTGTDTSTTISGLTTGVTYEVQVKAHNDEGESEWSGTGRGATSANNAPVFAGQPATASVPENSDGGTAVVTITATDADAGDTITYTLDSDSDALFDIDPSTGAITVQDDNSLDHEAQASYLTVVTARDGTAEVTHSLTIHVSDVLEAPDAPSAPSVTAGASPTSVEVTWTAPDTTGKPPVTDYDVQYRVAGAVDWIDAGYDGVGTATTIGSLTQGTDYEAQVRAINDEGMSEWSEAGRGATATRVQPRPGSGRVSGPTVTLEFDEALDTQSVPDPEDFSVTAVDDAAATGFIPPSAVSPVRSSQTQEHRVTAVSIDGSTLALTVSPAVPAGQSITVSYTPGTKPLRTVAGMQVLAFSQTVAAPPAPPPEDTTSPMFDDGPSVTLHIAENSAAGELVGTVLATDEDGDAPNYSLQSESGDHDSFVIDSGGHIRVADAAVLDFEAQAQYTFTAAVTDGEDAQGNAEETPTSDDTIEVSVQVSNVEEPPGAPTDLTVSPASATSLEVTWTAPADVGARLDGYDVQYRAAGETQWVDRPHSGTATQSVIEDLPTATDYEVRVRSLGDGNSEWTTGEGHTAVPAPTVIGTLPDLTLIAGATPVEVDASAAFAGDELVYVYTSSDASVASFDGQDSVTVNPGGTARLQGEDAGVARIEVTARNDGGSASVTFGVTVQAVSAKEAEALGLSLNGLTRTLLSSATGVIGARMAGSDTAAPSLQSVNVADAQAALAGLLGLSATAPASAAPSSGFGFAGDQSSGTNYGFEPGRGTASGDGLNLGAGLPPDGILRSHDDMQSRSARTLFPSGGLWNRSFAFSITADSEQTSGEAPTPERAPGLTQSCNGAAPAPGQATASPRWTVWGAGDMQRFSGGEDAQRYEGDWRTVYIGADRRFGPCMLGGVAVSRGEGEADYVFGGAAAGAGRLQTDLTAVYPYVRGVLMNGTEVWAMLGAGTGEATNVRGLRQRIVHEGDLRMGLAAAGLRTVLAERKATRLSVLADAGTAMLEIDGDGSLADLESSAQRARLGLELSGTGALSPYIQFNGRFDGGDGVSDAGYEAEIGLRRSGSRVDFGMRGRWMALSGDTDHEESGATMTLRVKAADDGTGLSASLTPSWGRTGGTDFVWSQGAPMPVANPWAGTDTGMTLNAELGYGIESYRLRGLVTPMIGFQRVASGDDRLQFGVDHAANKKWLPVQLNVGFGLQRQQTLDGPAWGAVLRTQMRW